MNKCFIMNLSEENLCAGKLMVIHARAKKTYSNSQYPPPMCSYLAVVGELVCLYDPASYTGGGLSSWQV